MTLDNLALLFKEAGCRNLYAKVLAKNDNSKQQIYFGPGFSALSLFPNRGVTSDEKPGNETFKAQLSFSWIAVDGQLSRAPGAQLILYPLDFFVVAGTAQTSSSLPVSMGEFCFLA
jgi:hypothetical protein